MRTSRAPTQTDRSGSNVGRLDRTRGLPTPGSLAGARAGFVLIEMIVVISILALFVLMVQVNLFGALRRSRFKADVQEFVSAMQMAASAAAESSRRYEIIIDIGEQMFILREITSSDLAQVLDEEIIIQKQFGPSCQIAYVEFDDNTYANEGRAKFRVGHGGWHYGGKVVFLDEDEQPHAIVVDRVMPVVKLVEGDPALMVPKAKDEVPFL